MEVDAASLEQGDLDRLLREHALGKLKVKKTDAREAMSWLIEEGASLDHPSPGSVWMYSSLTVFSPQVPNLNPEAKIQCERSASHKKIGFPHQST